MPPGGEAPSPPGGRGPQEVIAARRRRRCSAAPDEVLVDGQQKGRWRGRTRGNQLVFFDAPGVERDWLGKLVKVRVTETHAWHVIGEVE